MAYLPLLDVPVIKVADFQLTGGDTLFNLIAATTNALNGAILARRPDHYRNFTALVRGRRCADRRLG
jgi:hypothetical protein